MWIVWWISSFRALGDRSGSPEADALAIWAMWSNKWSSGRVERWVLEDTNQEIRAIDIAGEETWESCHYEYFVRFVMALILLKSHLLWEGGAVVVSGFMSPLSYDVGGHGRWAECSLQESCIFKGKSSCQEKLSQLWALTHNAFSLLYLGEVEKKIFWKGKQQIHRFL